MQKRRIYALILGIGAISLIRSTVGQGTDFRVFWKAGAALLRGSPIYQLAQDGGMVFKYPPWIAPLFIPVSLASFEAAKWIWGVFCVACMAGIFYLLTRKLKVRMTVWAPLAIFYWGLWVIHALDGQIIVPLLLLGLWQITREALPQASLQSGKTRLTRGLALAAVPLTYSSKVFTLFPFLFCPERFFKRRVVAWGVVLTIALSAITAVRGFHGDFGQMFHDWREAATSGAKYLPEGHTRGPKNQSLTSLACRWLSIPANDTRDEVIVALALFALAFFFFQKRMRGWSDPDRFLVGLALTPAFHPLSWHHLHLWTFPLAACSLQRWVDKKSSRTFARTAWLFGSVFLITLSSERAFGWTEVLRPFSAFLEMNVGRAWGALFLSLYAVTDDAVTETE